MPELLQNPTDAKVRQFIESAGFDINPMSGVEGDFYTTNRTDDLKLLVREILADRESG